MQPLPLRLLPKPQSAAAQNLHFQFSSDIIVDGVQIYQYPDAANADGIDIDSSRDVIVRNTMVDSNDDHLCVKSGANWLGKRDTFSTSLASAAVLADPERLIRLAGRRALGEHRLRGLRDQVGPWHDTRIGECHLCGQRQSDGGQRLPSLRPQLTCGSFPDRR